MRVALADIPDGEARGFEAPDGRPVLLARSAAGLFAAENLCPHAQQDFDGGRVRGHFLFCPHHGMRFDLRDGRPIGTVTKAPIRVYPVRVEGDAAVVALPPR
jgi:3-phenylpropionate/trans-cinnamate dioxygenase ferredoxin subunit